jgi:hypothetical protein
MTDPALLPLLRLEVGRLRAREPRRRFDSVVHVGALGDRHRSCVVPSLDPRVAAVLDAGTRTDLLVRLLEEEPPHPREACVWVSRPGEPDLEDGDLAWYAAAARAFATVGCSLDGCWAVTRTGWLDVLTGERRTWKRLRL